MIFKEILCAIVAATILAACGGGGAMSSGPKAGGYYSFQAAGNGYKVLKVLGVEGDIIHAAYYNNFYETRPGEDVLGELRFGRFNSTFDAWVSQSGGQTYLGRKHVAISSSNWDDWEPQFLSQDEVSAAEKQRIDDWRSKGAKLFPGIPNQ